MRTIKEIKELLQNSDVSPNFLNELQKDERQGVKNLLTRYYKQQEKLKIELENFEKRKEFELPLWNDNQIVAGIDEVGRGPLAGPVVTAAVILPSDNTLISVNDSKQLSEKKRDELFGQIMSQAIDVSVFVGSSQLIDSENIYHATEICMGEAVKNLHIKPTHLLVDAMTVPVDIPQEKLIKGDARSVSIASASIVAKVVRDRLMVMYDRIYPGYDFAHNVGYGTKKHLEGLKTIGITPIHRKTFAPVKDIV